MLSRLAKLLLILTSFAPVLLTLSFVSWLRGEQWWQVILFIATAVLLTLMAIAIIFEARRRLELIPITVESLKTVDREIIGFIVAYLLPLISNPSLPNIDWRVGAFVLAIFFVVVWGTHSYHFNPLLGILGFHFYEVTTDGKVTFVLITRRDLRHTQKVTRVVQISEYMILDATEEER